MSESDLVPGWLRQLGFQAHPFKLRQAGLEERLGEYFVPPPGFEVMRQPYTTLLFAPRGAGKTACRVMVERACRPTDPQARSLAIPYYRALESVAKQLSARDWAQTGRERHIQALLKTSVHALLNDLLARSSLSLFPDQLALLRGLIELCDNNFFSPSELLLRLREVNALTGTFDLAHVLESIPARRLRSALGDALNPDSRGGQLIVDLVDAPTLTITDDPLNALARIARPFEIDHMFVLIDGLDEFSLYAGNLDDQADLLLPLLSDLTMLEHPVFKFKFFLPADLRPVLEGSPQVRLDRLPAHSVSWSDQSLLELLRLRLQAFSDGRVQSLGALFDEPRDVMDVDVRLAGWANGSPRALLELGDELLAIHSRRNDTSPKLTAEDWEALQSRFQTQYAPQLIPPLWVDEKSRQVFIGERPLTVGFTPGEFALLCLLYRRAGQTVGKDDIWREVMGYGEDGVSDTAIDSLVFRTRKKIEKDSRNPVYLQTVRGEGYVLRNVRERR